MHKPLGMEEPGMKIPIKSFLLVLEYFYAVDDVQSQLSNASQGDKTRLNLRLYELAGIAFIG